MRKQAPSFGRVATMAAFALSCFGILVYLWLVFGGSVPLRAEGYRVKVPFPEAALLAQEADVRISGVPVGRVKRKQLAADRRSTLATLEIGSRYAPLPADTRAILRQKTLLGETYVELTPGSRSARRVPDGGTLPRGQVSETVELDEVFRTFDRRTREALGRWLDEQGRAVGGQGRSLSDALGNLAPFAEDTRGVLEVLDAQDRATSRLVRDTGEVFGALTERRGQLRGLIESSERVFEATAERDEALKEAFVAFPAFLRETRATVTRVTRFAREADPLVTQLRPAARELSPTLGELHGLAPDLKRLLGNLGPLIDASIDGMPAFERVLGELEPLLGQLDPFLSQLNPVLMGLTAFRSELTAFLANSSAATQATDVPPGATRPIHYLRTTNPIGPESLAQYPKRLVTNRSNPYMLPRGYDRLGDLGHLETFGQYLCESSGAVPRLGTVEPNLPARTRALIERYAYAGRPPAEVPAVPCRAQRPLGSLLGQPGVYPQLEAQR